MFANLSPEISISNRSRCDGQSAYIYSVPHKELASQCRPQSQGPRAGIHAILMTAVARTNLQQPRGVPTGGRLEYNVRQSEATPFNRYCSLCPERGRMRSFLHPFLALSKTGAVSDTGNHPHERRKVATAVCTPDWGCGEAWRNCVEKRDL